MTHTFGTAVADHTANGVPADFAVWYEAQLRYAEWLISEGELDAAAKVGREIDNATAAL